jgi:hypothetical protein
MAKKILTAVSDLNLDFIKAYCDAMVLCSEEPDTFEETETYALADVPMVEGDFTKGDHTPDGRELAVSAKPGITVDANGTGTHIALVDISESLLVVVTECDPLAVTTPGTVDFPSWKIINRAPT